MLGGYLVARELGGQEVNMLKEAIRSRSRDETEPLRNPNFVERITVRPDYVTTGVSVGIPYFFNLVGPTVAVSVDHNGNYYLFLGVSVAKGLVPSFYFHNGTMTQIDSPSPELIQNYMVDGSIDFTAGFWTGAGYNTNYSGRRYTGVRPHRKSGLPRDGHGSSEITRIALVGAK